jgi:DNA-binding transcriptional regulator/RsmH inhibitor MraZ
MDFAKEVIPFAGQYDADFDNKNRFTVPHELHECMALRNPRVQYRNIMYARLGQVADPGPDKCFYVLMNDVASYVHRPAGEDCALWTPLTIRDQRRLIVPGHMASEAKLEKNIVVSATADGKGIELWNPVMHKMYRQVPTKLTQQKSF